MRIVAGLISLTVCSAVAYASTYAWVDTNRPPVSLAEALQHAERLLGDSRVLYYCINASINGDVSGDPKTGTWNLMFGAADGSRRHIYVNMQAESHIRVWNGPVDWAASKGRRTDLNDVRDRVAAVLRSHSLEPDTQSIVGSVLTITKSSRPFHLHTLGPDGEFSAETQSIVGPKKDGICIRVTHVDQQPPEKPYQWQRLYWNIDEQNFILADGNGFLVAEITYGSEFPSKVEDQIMHCFGERLP